MPAYVNMTDITGMIPGPFLVQALDDNGDGNADAGVWDQIAQDVADVINGTLGKRYPVPFHNPLPSAVTKAAKTLAAEQIYIRRGKSGKDNPFADKAAAVMTELESIAAGEQPLDPAQNRALPSVTIIGAPATTTSLQGRAAV